MRLLHRPKNRPLCRALLLAAVLGGCAPGRSLPPLPPAPGPVYRLGPGDMVRLIVFGEDTMSSEFRVSDSGAIAVPLAGSVRAAGLTTVELQTSIAEVLKHGGVLRDPSVSVEVVTYRPVFVLGEVNKPGQYPYQPGMTVVSAAAVAGGFTYRAIEAYASVVRTAGETSIEAKAQRHNLVQPGDVITIFERRF